MSEYTKGSDYDLEAAIEYNAPGISIDEVGEVLAVVYGERDESDYYWILRLKDGRTGLLQGGHDFTGWECQSSAWWKEAATPEEALAHIDDGEDKEWMGQRGRPVREFMREQLNGVPPEKSAYQTVMERMGFPKHVGRDW